MSTRRTRRGTTRPTSSSRAQSARCAPPAAPRPGPAPAPPPAGGRRQSSRRTGWHFTADTALQPSSSRRPSWRTRSPGWRCRRGTSTWTLTDCRRWGRRPGRGTARRRAAPCGDTWNWSHSRSGQDWITRFVLTSAVKPSFWFGLGAPRPSLLPSAPHCPPQLPQSCIPQTMDGQKRRRYRVATQLKNKTFMKNKNAKRWIVAHLVL